MCQESCCIRLTGQTVLVIIGMDVGSGDLYNSLSIFTFPLQFLPPVSEHEAGFQPT